MMHQVFAWIEGHLKNTLTNKAFEEDKCMKVFINTRLYLYFIDIIYA